MYDSIFHAHRPAIFKSKKKKKAINDHILELKTSILCW